MLYTLGLYEGRRSVRAGKFDRLGQLAKIKEGVQPRKATTSLAETRRPAAFNCMAIL